ncbi:glycosyltransferase [Marinobacter sp. BGYM27]|nr:glycosyltransferase [Marinobacter sp. BGYM27]
MSGVVVNSEAVKKVTMDAEGFSDYSVSVIYNGFDDEIKASCLNSEFNKKLRCLKDQGRQLIGLVANIRPIKRIDDVIGALGMLKDSNPDLDLVVIGSGDISELHSLAIELGVGSRVHFLGACNNVTSSLPFFDIGVLSSESEGFSNSLVEYMRAALPVVCSAVGGNPEAVEAGVNGFLYPVGNINELRKAIEILANDGALRAKMGGKGKSIAIRRYSITEMTSAHTRLYRSYSSE